MLRSMFSAISGLRSHQTMMDVIGNNIANVNTVGYKSARLNFQDILSQNLRGTGAPQNGLGSTNPAQVGLGVTIAGIDVMHTQGNLQTTGKMTDMAIQGDGFFVLANGQQAFYTRDGSFDIGSDGRLVQPSTGLRVQGWQADAQGNVNTAGAVGDLVIPVGQRTTALASAAATLRGNLDASAAVGATATTTVAVYDSLGVRHSVNVTFTKTAANAWSWAAAADPADVGTSTTSSGTLTFSAAGDLTAATGSPISLTVTNGAASPVAVTADFTGLGQRQGASEVAVTSDGYASGTLVSIAVAQNGEIAGVYSNGQVQRVGQLATAAFVNPGGLMRAAGNMFQASAASGQAVVGQPGQGGRGIVSTGALEMSNVDLATQFTSMITAQRGFQANGRIITTSDEMLQELVNLKR